jgi:hypothetical protein
LEKIAASFFMVVLSSDCDRDEGVSKFLRNVSKLLEFQEGQYCCENIGCSSRSIRESGLTSVRLHHIGFNLGAGDSVGDEGGVV